MTQVSAPHAWRLLLLVAVAAWVPVGAGGIGAQEVIAPPAGYAPAVPLYPAPFSRDAQVRERQAIARQLAVLDWTRWQSQAWSMHGPEELWLFGPPLSFAWEFPAVEQPIGYHRRYDGRGGYSSVPVYADQFAPPPPPRPLPVEPPMIREAPAEEPVLGRRGSQRPAVHQAPAARTAEAGETRRRLFSW